MESVSFRGGKNSEKCRISSSCWLSSDAVILAEFYQEERFVFRPEDPSSLWVDIAILFVNPVEHLAFDFSPVPKRLISFLFIINYTHQDERQKHTDN